MAPAARRRLVRFLVPLGLLAAWQALSGVGLLPRNLLPPPSAVLYAWADWIVGFNNSAGSYSGGWLGDAAASGMRVLAGFSLAAVSGITLGIAIGWSRFAEASLEPTLQVLRPIPPVSWIPLAVIWFGIANKPAVFLVFLGAFFPILMNTIHGVRNCDANLVRAGAMMGGREYQLLRFIVFPAALPSIFAGLRIGIGSAWMLTVTAEMVAVKSGLGYVLWDSYNFFRYDLVLAAMASIGALGFASDLAVKALMGAALHWQQGTTVQGRQG
jgi:NitT/TauT family transport system permease protein